LTARLATTPRKQVYLFVHGFDNTFEHSIFTIAELWHFLGREGVPIAYTWPCGAGGVSSYLYTINSGQFTNFHLKRALRLIAACPAVEKIHIIAHSRGTDGAITAVRDLWLECRGTPGAMQKLKLGTCVWAAADIDMEADEQWNMAERVNGAVESAAIYISHEDRALAFSTWLMGGKMRLGDVDESFFTKEEIDALRSTVRVQIIDARLAHPGFVGHSYFHTNPAVSSDLILFLRYHLLPGTENGRPLGQAKCGFWIVDDKYPGSKWKPPPAVLQGKTAELK
jgi:esterase/lipase superfamily enzyme